MNLPSLAFKPFDNYHRALEHAASLWGIELEYWDIWGQRHVTSPEVQRAILTSLGVAAASLDELNRSLEERLWGEWSAICPPAMVLSENDSPVSVPVRVPAALADCVMDVELNLEDGNEERRQQPLASLEVTAGAELRGRKFVEKQLRLEDVPLGYHQLRLSAKGTDGPVEGTTALIMAPARAYLPPELAGGGKRAGLYVSLYGLKSANSWGCGDFSDLERLCAWVADRLDGSFVALNPLHAIHNRQPFNTSPYLPNSIFFQNLIYLDIERIEDYQDSTWARGLRASDSIKGEIDTINAADFVEYERIARLKSAFLKLAFRRFLHEYREGTERAGRFREFVASKGELLDRYAIYCALDERLHQRNPNVWTWPEWPPEYRDPASAAVQEFAAKYWRQVLFVKYVQWQIDLQLAEAQARAREKGLSIGLFHDLALATDRCGSDLWAYRDFFVSGCRVGAPPDSFSPKGQDWSFPPPDGRRHREDGYRLFRESIRRSCEHGGALRIDHVMRFFRLFWIPAGKEAIDGTYVLDNHEDLVRILALESVRNQVVIVGEDLGTVDPATRETLARYGILSYRLFYFERKEGGRLNAPAEYPPQALVASTTHDLPTLAGFWQSCDIEARRDAGVFPNPEAYHGALVSRRQDKQSMLDSLHELRLLPNHVPRNVDHIPELTGELHNAIIGFLAATPSALLAINQEDLTKETEQQNLPGTTEQYPNWRRKMRYTIEELETSKTVENFARMVRHWLAKAGRAAR